MLKEKEFIVLEAFARLGACSQRVLADHTGLSLGTVNSAAKNLREAGLLDGSNVTESGFAALEPYRVDNAIIMAAGLSSRFAPISYEKPKGLLRVRDEILIERQIMQLKETGIRDITVVVGYKKEQFFYLEDRFGVQIVVNDQYASRNNNSSLMAVIDKLGSTYICSSDDYFVDNPFSEYAWKAYYAGQYCEGSTEEWCMELGPGRRIVKVTIGGAGKWYMIGHAYFDRAFSERFSTILRAEYNNPDMSDKLWEQIFMDHVHDFDMVMKPYPDGFINEFDSLDELRTFDENFLENVDSEIFNNIEKTLDCSRNEISNIYPLKQGLTNLSCHFNVGDKEYVYRHPGVGTEQLVDRKSESNAQRIAKELGLDDTFIYEDAAIGWKLSHFIVDCCTLDVDDDSQLERAMAMARLLHESGASVEKRFDFYSESRRYEELLGGRNAIDIPDFAELAEISDRLHAYVDCDEKQICLTHNDFFTLNILIDKNDKMHLIDWEYAGMSDYASDFGTFVVCAQLSEERAITALEYYFDRKPTDEELRHNFAFVGFAGWCWYLWSLYKESQGEIVGEWLRIYYSYGKKYLKKALSLYENGSAIEHCIRPVD